MARPATQAARWAKEHIIQTKAETEARAIPSRNTRTIGITFHISCWFVPSFYSRFVPFVKHPCEFRGYFFAFCSSRPDLTAPPPAHRTRGQVARPKAIPWKRRRSRRLYPPAVGGMRFAQRTDEGFQRSAPVAAPKPADVGAAPSPAIRAGEETPSPQRGGADQPVGAVERAFAIVQHRIEPAAATGGDQLFRPPVPAAVAACRDPVADPPRQ